MVFRVHPDGVKLKYVAGQYGALGLLAEALRVDGAEGKAAPGTLIKRAYSVSSPIIDNGQIVDPDKTGYYEFYVDLVPLDDSAKPRLSSRLFALKDNDRIFLGTKVVGHYNLHAREKGKNTLFIASTTGEAPHNSMVAEILKVQESCHIAQVVVSEDEWESAYKDHHHQLTGMFPQYKYISLNKDKCYNRVHQKLEECLTDSEVSKAVFGWALDPQNTHVYLCGDPKLIGAPVKLGAWQYEYPDYGLMRLLQKFNFQPATRFQPGNVSHESYW